MTAARALVCALIAASLVGCTQFPELDDAVSAEAEAAPQPVLMDNRPLLAAARGGTIDPSTQASLQARAATLQATAEGLQGPVIPPDERQSLLEAHGRLRDASTLVAPDT